MGGFKKIKDVYQTKAEYLKAGKKLLKKFGFKDGIPLAKPFPAHYVTNLIKDRDTGIMAWMMDIEKRRYTVIAYPSEINQRQVRMKISDVDCLYKYFTYRPKSIGQRELRRSKKSYGAVTGIREFNRNKDLWIKKAYRQLRSEGIKGAIIYKKIKHKFVAEKPFSGMWTTRKRSLEEVPIKRDPYNLKETTIKNIIFKK